MNKFSKLFLALAASTMMLSSCSSDEPATSIVAPSEGGVYATLTLQLPQGRSTTLPEDEYTPGSNSSNGYEEGNDSENNVGAVLVVLTDVNYNYITSSLADAHVATGNNARPTYNIQFETKELWEHENEKVYVFTYCNPTRALRDTFEALTAGSSIADLEGKITDASISTKNGFLMTNALLSDQITLPSKDQMTQQFNTPSNPFNLGTVKVQRVTARFDFQETTIENYDKNTYPIFNHNNSDLSTDPATPDGPVAFVEINGMALLNQAINYYYLPRVSANGTLDNATLCGYENNLNYVVSPGFAEKAGGELKVDWLNANYQFTGLAATTAIDFTTLDYQPMGQNLGADNDNETWTGTTGDYFIWNYVSENTIPAYDFGGVPSYQRVGCTTGIVFRAQLKAANNGGDLGNVITTGTDVIYGYNGVLYGNLSMLKKAVKANPVSTLADAFMKAFNIVEYSEEAVDAVITDLTQTAGGFALYTPTAGKYYMYYTYLNRHNDNSNNTLMAPMEFSVVRNNVYKLKVENVLEFGHPGKPGEDPDPEDPNNPDEEPKTYFRVQVKVLPWVVRVNNIIL